MGVDKSWKKDFPMAIVVLAKILSRRGIANIGDGMSANAYVSIRLIGGVFSYDADVFE